MTIPSAFITKGVGDKLTAGDANTLNADIQMALDKRAGVTDTLASIVTATGAGRIVDSYAFGLNADTTYVLSGGNTIIDASGILTVDRNYTLSNTGAVNGDRCTVIFNSANCVLNVRNNAGTLLIVLGAYVSGAAAFASVGESSWGDFEWNGAWTLVRSAKPAVLTPTTYTANGTWTCPRGLTLVMLIGYGGGGGGGGASPATAIDGVGATGGGGGGGAQLSWQVVPVTAGTAIAITIGAGGSGGAAGNPGASGTNTTFGGLATFAAAGGGGSHVLTAVSALNTTLGGSPVALSATELSIFFLGRSAASPTLSDAVQTSPGSGGRGINAAPSSMDGTPSVQGFAGGVGGNAGGSGSGRGGGGGGGGAGPNGAGGAGGVGGFGNAGATGLPGTIGAAAASNAGSGGGGGGAGGSAVGAGGASAAGGAGASGQLTVVPLR